MEETTIVTSSPAGKQLNQIKQGDMSYLMVRNKKVKLVGQIKIGRESDNDIVIDNKLASRYHCMIQKIKDAYFIKDEGSTNGTILNGSRILPDKYVRLNLGDKITVGSETIVIS